MDALSVWQVSNVKQINKGVQYLYSRALCVAALWQGDEASISLSCVSEHDHCMQHSLSFCKHNKMAAGKTKENFGLEEPNI